MADPLSVSSGVIALVTFAFQSSVALYTTVRNFQSQDKRARALKNELGELSEVLESLLETVNNKPELDFKALQLPLHRCGRACEEYGEIIARCSKHSTASRPSLRDWLTQKYLQGDITDFQAMLAGYKSTINIALANANIRVAAITPRVLDDYHDMIRDTTNDLQEHLHQLDEKVRRLAAGDTIVPANDNNEWQAMLEEKDSTQQGLLICAQLAARIEELEPTVKENLQYWQRDSARKHVKEGLGSTKGSIQALVSRLQNHEESINRQMEAIRSVPASQSTATQLSQLKETSESVRQCIKLVSDADDLMGIERRNVFEDITMADDTYDFSVSTVGDLVTARRINLKGKSRHVGGQISDDSYQKTILAFTQMFMCNQDSSKEADEEFAQPDASQEPRNGRPGGSQFHDRYGQGFRLSRPTETKLTP